MVISSDQLKEEVAKRTQINFHPTAIGVQSDLEYTKSVFHCIRCNQIPLDIELCTECEEIVCKPCQDAIENLSKANQGKMQCPSESCQNSEKFSFKKLKNRQSIKMLSQLTEHHSCKVDFGNHIPDGDQNQNLDSEKSLKEEQKLQESPYPTQSPKITGQLENQTDEISDTETSATINSEYESAQPQSAENEDGKQMNIFDLYIHLDQDCPKNRSCFHCERTFRTKEEFQGHLKFACESVKIHCQACNMKITRKEFRLHQCFVDQSLNDLNLPDKHIELKLHQNRLIVNELNDKVSSILSESQLLKQASEKSIAKVESDHAQTQNELKRSRNEHNQTKNELTKMTNKFNEERKSHDIYSKKATEILDKVVKDNETKLTNIVKEKDSVISKLSKDKEEVKVQIAQSEKYAIEKQKCCPICIKTNIVTTNMSLIHAGFSRNCANCSSSSNGSYFCKQCKIYICPKCYETSYHTKLVNLEGKTAEQLKNYKPCHLYQK